MKPHEFTIYAGDDHEYEQKLYSTVHFMEKLYQRILEEEKPPSSIQASLQRSVVIPLEERPPVSRITSMISGSFLRATYFYDSNWDALYVLVPDDGKADGPIKYVRTVYKASHSGWFDEWKKGRTWNELQARKVAPWYRDRYFDGTPRKEE